MKTVIINTLIYRLGEGITNNIKQHKKDINTLYYLLVISAGSLITSVAIATPILNSTTQTLTTPVSQNLAAQNIHTHNISEEQHEKITYFLEIAMGSEYGNTSPHIRKWTSDLYINVQGNPTPQDHITLNSIVEELNNLIDTVDIYVLDDFSQTRQRTNVAMHFVPSSEFRDYIPQYNPGNRGYTWVWWEDNEIYNATILIATDPYPNNPNEAEGQIKHKAQAARNHLIREELTQSLGLLQDSSRYNNSIFYQPWTDTETYSELDEDIITTLYHPDIEPGMNTQQVRNVLNSSPDLWAHEVTPE